MARRGLDGERVLVCMATAEREAVLFELKAQHGQCTTDTLRRYTGRTFTARQDMARLFTDIKALAPAARYGMVVGCHGLAWVPVQHCQGRARRTVMHYDRQVGNVHTRYIGGLTAGTQAETADLAGALADAGLHTEYILFDACYMSSVEVAYELKDVTRYLIACPTEVIGYGFPYLTMGACLLGSPDYQGIVDAFMAFYSTYSLPYGTMAVTDCTQLDALADVVRQVNTSTAGLPEPDGVQVTDGYTPPLFYDLGHYLSLKGAPAVLASAVAAQLELTVPYKGHTPQYLTALKSQPVDINYYSGLNTSEPSRNRLAARENATAWYKATH